MRKPSFTPCTSKLLLTGAIYKEIGTEFHNSLSKRPLLIRLGLTRLLLLPESLGLILARIRLSLKRLLLIGLTSLTIVVYYEF